MSGSEIGNMDVIADASSVRRGIVVAINCDVITLAKRNFQCKWNQMAFGAMILPPATGGAGSVEISQARIAQAMNFVEPCEHLFHEELGFSVRVHRVERVRFFDRGAFGYSIQSRRGRKNKSRHFVSQHCFQEGQRIGRIIPEVTLRDLHGFAGLDPCREVHYSFKIAGLQNSVESGAIADIGNCQHSAFGYGGSITVGKVIENRNIVAPA